MKNPFVFITRLPFTRVMSVYAAISSTREYPVSIPSHLPLTRWWALWFPWLNVSFLDFTEWNSQFKSYTWITLLQPLTHCISLNLRLIGVYLLFCPHILQLGSGWEGSVPTMSLGFFFFCGSP